MARRRAWCLSLLAVLSLFPFLDLPEEVDQSNPAMQDWYQSVSYTTPRGQTFRGTYAAYGVTIPVAAASPVPPIIAMYIHEMGRMDADPYGAALTGPIACADAGSK